MRGGTRNGVPLRILHTEASCGWGGQEIRILSEAQGLIQRGHYVELVCPAEARIYAETTRFGVPARALPIGRKNLRGLLAMRHLLRETSFDVINTHSSTDAWLTALACASCPAPPPMVRTRHISAAIPANAATRWLYAYSTRHIVTTGEALRGQLLATLPIYPNVISSVPTGVDTQRYVPLPVESRAALRARLCLPVHASLVGIVATLRSWKGHRYLIEAFAQATPSEAHLLIVGDGPQREALRALVDAPGLRDRVTLAGDQSDVAPWLQALDVFALPSYANEGVPQALMQAMATGLACVTTPVGAILELAHPGETALVVPPHDVPALGRALSRLLANPALRARLGEAARDHIVEHFGMVPMLDRMEAIFRACASRYAVAEHPAQRSFHQETLH